MFLTDFNYIFNWWLVIFSLSLLTLPLTFRLFHKFWDYGYTFAKTISICLSAYIIFVLSSFHLLKFNFVSIFIVFLVIGLTNYLPLIKNIKNRESFCETLKTKWSKFIFLEILFLLVLSVWSYVRGFSPDVEGLEKFMDWGFINSILRTDYLPPQDMWYALSSVNYYYFGQLIFALLTKISGISSAITYNLSIATVCALTFVSGFSLTSNLVFTLVSKNSKKLFLSIGVGLTSAFLLTFGGNLHTVYKIVATSLKDSNSINSESLTKAANTYWYPDATRFIGYDPDTTDKTIHEFPMYSFVVADLHGHMNDIPIVLMFCAVIFAFALSKKSINSISFSLIGSLILSIAYMTNAWDFAVYGLLFAVFSFLINMYQGRSFYVSFNKTFFNGLLLIALWFLWSWPFSRNFLPMAQGLRLSDAHSPFYQLVILYGGFWLICFPFVFYILYRFLVKKPLKLETPDIFVTSLIILATMLIVIPEIIYIKDIYTEDYRRANTMFKLVYEAFILYSVSSGYVLFRLSSVVRSRGGKFLYKLIFVLVFLSHLIYPYFAIKSNYNLTDPSNYKGLWGLGFLKNQLPDNYNAVNWINQNIKDQPVMLEASGDSYTLYNHVSASTGLPTVVGWLVHEWLWRNGYDAPAARQTDVNTVYNYLSGAANSKDTSPVELSEVKSILDKYKIEYLFVGSQEYEKYPDISLDKLKDLGGKVVFQSGKTVIYQL